MAVIVYSVGDEVEVHGVRCKEHRIPVKKLAAYWANGCVSDPRDLSPTKEEADTNGTGKLSSMEIREAAKNSGIEDWEKKRIGTLLKELNYD